MSCNNLEKYYTMYWNDNKPDNIEEWLFKLINYQLTYKELIFIYNLKIINYVYSIKHNVYYTLNHYLFIKLNQ
jgi:hypothetical protein